MKLIILAAGERSERVFAQPAITLGRSAENDITLQDQRVSRLHCTIDCQGSETVLIDQGSQNGTMVNGQKVKRQVLKAGDVIGLGDVRICYEYIPEKTKNPKETVFLQAARNIADETIMREVARERDNLNALQKINKAINTERDLRPLLNLIVDAAIQLTHAERGFIILGRGENSQFEVARNFAREPVEMPELKISRSITSKVWASGEAMLSLNAKEDERFQDFASVENLGLMSVICIPLRIKNEIHGVLYVDNRLQKGIFTEEHLDLLASFADQAAIAIDNAQLLEQLRESNQKLKVTAEEVQSLNLELGHKVQVQAEELRQAKTVLLGSGGKRKYANIIGESAPMLRLFKLLDRIIPTDFPVLIEGESGTGKELVACAIHLYSLRKNKAFITQNCAALSATLLESELFGHAKGAFTGAHRAHKGLLEGADGGTLFLDEVGEMSMDLQKKFLRVLQEGEIRPVGSDRVIQTNVRIVSASNRRLEDLVAKGEFREDLFFRLNVLAVEMPPLRKRSEDIALLMEHFLKLFCMENKVPIKKIDRSVLPVLERYDWPGNVRELQNEIRKWVVLEEGLVTAESLSARIRTGRGRKSEEPGILSGTLPEQIQQLERQAIERALSECSGNKSKAARALGLSRFALQRKLDKFGIEQQA